MPISITLDESKGIIYTKRSGDINHEDREQAVKDLSRLKTKYCSLLLVDGRGQKEALSGSEGQNLIRLSKQLGLNFRRVAIVEPEKSSPYILIISDAFIDGVNIQEFTDIAVAEAWLLS